MRPLIVVFAIAACGRVAFDPHVDSASDAQAGPGFTAGTWTWISGSTLAERSGVYGVRGVRDSANVPGGRDNGGAWLVGDNELWFAGGFAHATAGSGVMNDVWRYEIDRDIWTWIQGATSVGATAVFGTADTPAAGNTPGAANDMHFWRDTTNGNFYLHGGDGFDATSKGALADVWRFDPSLNQWAWVAGTMTIDATASYGQLGVRSATNRPGARGDAFVYPDAAGVITYGGFGRNASASANAPLADWWQFDDASRQWTWIGGTQTQSAPAVYGPLGVADATATPGGRESGCAWRDARGLWLFGGTSGGVLHNDLWRYDLTSQQWTLMRGDGPAVFGVEGIADPANTPPVRAAPNCWQDARGRFWMFAGIGNAGNNALHDLWMYDPPSDQWIWVAGSSGFDVKGVYGTRGVAAATNAPGARTLGDVWATSDGALWLFGGDFGIDVNGTNGHLNDLWKFVPN